MEKQKNLNDESGITLVSLVVTIVVMLILAGVSISMVMGQNGVGTRAQNASINTETANIQDSLSQAVASLTTAYQSDWATNKNRVMSSFYFEGEKIEREAGFETGSINDINYATAGIVASIEEYPESASEETKAWAKITLETGESLVTTAGGISTTATDEVKYIIGTYNREYIFIIDIDKGSVKVYPGSTLDDRTQAANTDGGPTPTAGDPQTTDSMTGYALAST